MRAPTRPRIGDLRHLDRLPEPDEGRIEIENGRVESMALDLADTPSDLRIELAECEVVGLRIQGHGAGRLRARDAIFAGCQLTGMGEIDAMTRCAITDSKLTGSSFADAALTDVVFANCRLHDVNWRSARLRQVEFRDCDLRESDFGAADLEAVRFVGCDLNAVRFDRARIIDVDLRGSQITDVATPAALRGATISTEQAIELAVALAVDLGFKVVDD